jgi:hypothetical protein
MTLAKRNRFSVVVVLPASMCAMMPKLRILPSGAPAERFPEVSGAARETHGTFAAGERRQALSGLDAPAADVWTLAERWRPRAQTVGENELHRREILSGLCPICSNKIGGESGNSGMWWAVRAESKGVLILFAFYDEMLDIRERRRRTPFLERVSRRF